MTSGLLEAVENVLRACGKPLTARRIIKELADRGEATPGGATPWKTIGARLAVEIRSNADSHFMRVARGMYALTAWKDLVSVEVIRRHINPLDEDILVIDNNVFEGLKAGRRAGKLFDIHYRDLLKVARPMHRMKAEENDAIVQLIPSFIIFEEDRVLSFRRTKKSIEQRLHDSFSIVFGGHLQVEDNPALFVDDDYQLEQFIFRELHEELAFEPPFVQSSYVGILHLEGTIFERQHAGVIFAIDLKAGTVVKSLEPGYQSNLRFVPWSGIAESPIMEDSWSAACVAHMREAE